MVISWIYFRDQIIVDENFKNEISAEINFRKLAPGSTLLIGARDIRHTSNYKLRLENYNIVLITDIYNAAGGSIDVSGLSGIDGQQGPEGELGKAGPAENNRPGGNGGNGTNGTPGTDGMNVTIFTRQLSDGHFISQGGSGGKGGKGGNGGQGGKGRIGGTRFEVWEGTPGGNGGNGGTGAAGGNGGQLKVIYVDGNNPILDAAGGIGGAGGPAGVGGKGSEGQGAPGSPGSAGVNGKEFPSSSIHVDKSEFWDRLRNEIGSVSDDWANYRVRIGEYYFRTFTPAKQDYSNNLALAAEEFISALMLAPGNLKAKLRLDQINTNQNIIGVPRDFDLVPDYDRYERVVTDYVPLVQLMFQTCLDLLEKGFDVGSKKERLAGEIRHINDLLKILNAERDAAELAKAASKANLEMAAKRIDANNAEIEANREALEKLQLELEGQFVESVWRVAQAVVAVISAAYTAGASLAAIPGLLVSAQGTWRELVIDEKTGTATYKGKHLVDWIDWKDSNGKVNPKPKPEIAALIKGLKDVVGNSSDLISKAKVLSDIDKSTIEGDINSKYKELVRKGAELAFEHANNTVRLKQDEILAEAANLRINQANSDLQEILALQDKLDTQIITIAQIDRILINRVQEYANYITKYLFLAARSLELYTLEDMTSDFSYAYGYIHPDIEENAYAALARGDVSRVLSLMKEYILSWNSLPGFTYRDRYETYRMGLSTDLQFWHFKDPSSLNQLRQTAEFEFSIPIYDLLPNRLEPKVDTVYVSLIGATANDPRISCILEHSGQAYTRRRDGSIVTIFAPARQGPISASKVEGEFGGLQDPLHATFWGRSPAARWRLFIEPEVLTRSNVDLSGVSEIQIAVAYQSI